MYSCAFLGKRRISYFHFHLQPFSLRGNRIKLGSVAVSIYLYTFTLKVVKDFCKATQKYVWISTDILWKWNSRQKLSRPTWQVHCQMIQGTIIKTENCNYGCGMIFALENSSRTCLWRNSHKQKILINANFLEWEMYCHFFSEQVE